MASLQGTKIKNTYPGLLKTDDNGVVGAVEKRVTDGQGNATNMTIGTGGASFDSGTVDFTGATVSGLPADVNTTYDLASAQNLTNVDVTLTGSDATVDTVTLAAGTNITLTDNGSNQITIDASGGAAGLESGTGTDSMQSAASLTTTGANASTDCSIALGFNATTPGVRSVAIGRNALSGPASVAIGPDSDSGDSAVAIGTGAYAGSTLTAAAVAIGQSANTGNNNRAVALGSCTNVSAVCGIAIGNETTAGGANSIHIAGNASFSSFSAAGACSIAIGFEANTAGAESISLGSGSQALQSFGVTIGKSALASCIGDIAIGVTTCVTATAGEGSIGIGYAARNCAPRTITLGYVSRACNVGSTDSIAIGNFASVGPTDGTIAAPFAVAIGCGALSYEKSVAIGCTAVNSGVFTVAIGDQANGGTKAGTSVGASTDSGAGSVAIGRNSQATGIHAVAMGGQCNVFSTNGTTASGIASIAIGTSSSATNNRSIAIGEVSTSTGSSSTAVGHLSCAQGDGTVAIGGSSHARGTQAIAMGENACAYDAYDISIGFNSDACGPATIAIGLGAQVVAGNFHAVSIGCGSSAGATYSYALGSQTSTTASGAYALGRAVTAAKADTVSVIELETQLAGGGITMKSADTTEEKMTLTDADVLAIGGDTIPANDTATPTTVNRIWSGTSAQYTALGTYDANTLYYVS